MAEELQWQPFQLQPDDARLVDAYIRTGRSLDDLPYSPHMDDLLRAAGRKPSDDERRYVWKRLLSLRKRALLPRVFLPAKDDDQPI